MQTTTIAKRFPLAGAAALAILAIAFTVAHAETVDRSFEVGEGGTLVVETDLGSIEIQTANTQTAEVRVTKTGPRTDKFSVDFSHQGNDLTVNGNYTKSMGRGPKVRFIITVPKRYNVNLTTSGGSISVDDLEGEVRTKTSGGSLSFGEIQGTVWGRTSGGSVSIGSCSADVDVHTSGGSISIGPVNGSVEADTSGGSIKVAEVAGLVNASSSGGSVSAYITVQPADDCRLTTSGGGVTVTLADNIAVDLDAQTSGGTVSSDFELVGGSKTKRKMTGKINGGGPELYLRTSGGSIRVIRK